jgi:hypothetical protein
LIDEPSGVSRRVNMQQNQVIAHGIHGIIAERLRELAQTQRIWLRETSQIAACRNLLQSSAPTVFVLALGRDLAKELELLEEAHACIPGAATIVVGDSDNPSLAGLVFELGTTFCVFPPQPPELVADLVARFLPAEKP